MIKYIIILLIIIVIYLKFTNVKTENFTVYSLDNENINYYKKQYIYEKVDIGYNFSVDNDYNTIEYNDINATFSLNNIVTKFNFIQESGEIGNSVTKNTYILLVDSLDSHTGKAARAKKLNIKMMTPYAFHNQYFQ